MVLRQKKNNLLFKVFLALKNRKTNIEQTELYCFCLKWLSIVTISGYLQ